ncbi:MAG: AMIN domain-containing protein, partial [Candidatus Krumholzibacteria bacterium]|nr:AMIN domain-containing protein [Candidatus Krumholzibacteria bacterium]
MRTMTVLQRFGVAALVVALVAGVPLAHADDVVKVTALRLEKGANSSVYIIEQTGEAAYQEFLLPNPKRLVLDVVGAEHGLSQYIFDGDGRLVKGVRTSQFTNDPDEVTRIVFDLAEETEYTVSRRETVVEVTFFGKGKPAEVMDASLASTWDATQDATPKLEGEPKASAQLTPAQPTATQPAPAQPAPAQPAPAQPASPEPQAETSWADEMSRAQADVAEEEKRATAANPWAVAAQGPVRARSYPAELTAYTNTGGTRLGDDRISMDVQGADMKTVLRSVAEFSGANIIAGPDVEGPVTIHLMDVPWREALDIILK